MFLIENPPAFAKEGMLFKARFKENLEKGKTPWVKIEK